LVAELVVSQKAWFDAAGQLRVEHAVGQIYARAAGSSSNFFAHSLPQCGTSGRLNDISNLSSSEFLQTQIFGDRRWMQYVIELEEFKDWYQLLSLREIGS
jgi:hypothetical protein